MEGENVVQRLAFWSIFVGMGVLALKYAAYHVTGSVALYSDALESIVNVVAALAAWWAIRVSHKPADQNHPFGHHKAEYFSAVLEGVLIVVAALLILREVWSAWETPKVMEEPWLGLAINGGASLVNALWATLLISRARRHKSPALLADGKHIMTDVVTSAGVFIGLVGAVITGWTFLDPLLAVIVALNILWQGWTVIGSSVQGLMDVGVPTEETMRIRDIISANAGGALEVHDLKTRIAGRVTFIEFHLVVHASMSVGDAHVICDRMENALMEQIPDSSVVIHVEPEEEAKLPIGTAAVPFA
ncbi:cation diffusion facilitator family transporter [Phyllobacterium sp. 22229]|uniref:Protein p34 n=1 Tax=Phyllobacterium myrsinacearum TaxID=28101 RepID=A0A2S9JX23_9HYPH|nr:cation diffusion facilitator family transporter [Phyllobacterium myrsinacearum]PRD57762.1 cation-efflux pump [Phyllobacterium myrsinacearum]PWV88544.1 cation diffusion facilitator family transporter [Phyllobacterium myrsinacearum]RZS83202.1 cation diffusion facilitator family transporter [Phyllobacterium myrsinacearum]RZV10090.1 cation diffusion facilitator family transporter [Phyllobacterium myrsinacearum]